MKKMERIIKLKKVAVIGGGASGMMAAIFAADSGAEVTVFEKNDRVGKKILATGNGKCNFSNREFHTDCYDGTHTEMLSDLFAQFSVQDTVSFFQKAGMLSKDRNGYLYPLSEQASTVLDILRLELRRMGIRVRLQTDVKLIKRNEKNGMLTVMTESRQADFHSVILTCGGCAAPKTGSDGSGYRLAERLGHRIIPVVPALVQLRCRGDFFKMAAGVRCDALLTLTSGDKVIQKERGELQLVDYGISGIPVFQFSRAAAYLLREKKAVSVYIDFLPDYGEREYTEMCRMRIENAGEKSIEELLLGLTNKKINLALIKQAGMKPAEAAVKIGKEKLEKLLYSYRKLCVHVTDTNSFENAQVTAGGVDMSEVNEQMESAFVRGLYFAGEILDVDGRCGGYNLQWAWTSGYIAGRNAALQ